MEEERQLLRGHSPIDDAEDGQQWNNINQIIKYKIKIGTSLQRGNIHNEKERREIDLTCASRLKEGDNKPDKESGKKRPSELPGSILLQFIASGSYDAVNSLFQDIGDLERHL